MESLRGKRLLQCFGLLESVDQPGGFRLHEPFDSECLCFKILTINKLKMKIGSSFHLHLLQTIPSHLRIRRVALSALLKQQVWSVHSQHPKT
jgi:hypothetical protein